MKRAVLLALMLGVVSGAGYAQVPASTAAADAAVTRFYHARNNGPLWFRPGSDGEAASRLVAILRKAPLDGLPSGTQLANQVEAAVHAARSGDPKRVIQAERTLSSAWALYVQTLTAPTDGMLFGYPLPRGTNPDRTLWEAAKAPSLAQHLQWVSDLNPTYTQLREAAYRSAQAAGGSPDPRLLVNMERARSIPNSGRFVLVDAATARLWMYEDGQPVDSMKVVVGTIETPTPMLASMIHYATLNPYWNVPDNLIRKTVAPGAVKGGEAYLKAQGYQVMSDWTADATVVPAGEVDWKAVAAGQKAIRVRQLPGPTNAMGKYKFSFPNKEDIFLHDTPTMEHFTKAQRTISNGCIRLEDAQRFGRWLMKGQDPVAASSEPEQFVKLPEGVPVYVTYLTAQVNGSELTYADDVYGRDRDAAARVASLGAPPVESADLPKATP